ncbi:3,4-dihydroxy 2-butanone 4-phosphate synthase [Talaromyces islandicus]|uniref:3,4-dihydroxy-2-butanone 4-phosphate synthase n=1 Tax=Talaromyces islandicus TaxID=28573 RepID=A0A0U1LWN1_TALIS|nr:3,4-dihydroxy 2-butanone 4-phosphate synthase [Talaromyces islandicus]
MPSTTEDNLQFDSVEDVVAAFIGATENGQFVIILDSQDRENEGDLIIAADAVTEAQMAFLVRYSSGYVCAPILPSHADKLQLPQMVTNNADPLITAYTISIDSNEASVTTGISAHDRALTCRRLADPTIKPGNFRRPGHILPLRARDGGVRERRGHTEAAIDLCRLAGRAPAGVIGELVEEGHVVEGVAEVTGNNGMMRRDSCLRFGHRFGIKVTTIEDMVAYLKKVDPSGDLITANGH